MKNILMITPFFAPYSHAAVYRIHRFAKYLPRWGWKPYILTVDHSFLYFIDNALMDDLPKEVEIIPARYIEFSYSGLKLLFKKDRRIFQGPTSYDLTAELLKNNKYAFFKNVVGRLRDVFLSFFIPDQYLGWYPFAIKKAKEIIKSKHIDVIYTTAPPFTPSLIAMHLKNNFKIPWVADFRDWGLLFPEYNSILPFLAKVMDTWAQKKIIKRADFIVTPSESIRDIIYTRYQNLLRNNVSCIRHGYDIETSYNLKNDIEKKKFTIVFMGEFVRFYKLTLFEILNEIFKRQLFDRNEVKVLIIGSIKRNIYLDKIIKKLELKDVVKLIDYISIKDYPKILLSADCTFLPGHREYSISIKIPDYLFARKPIIAHDVQEEVADILEKSGLGLILPQERERAIEIMLKLLKREWQPKKINDTYINQFTAIKQTKKIVDLLSKLCER